MNGYICFYKSKRTEVHANTTREAQQIAAKHWKVKPNKEYEISVHLAEKGGQEVVHTADF